MKGRTDTADGGFGVKIVAHLVRHTHVAVEVEIEVDVTDAKVATQIADEHVFCPLFVYLLFFAKEGKQANKAG